MTTKSSNIEVLVQHLMAVFCSSLYWWTSETHTYTHTHTENRTQEKRNGSASRMKLWPDQMKRSFWEALKSAQNHFSKASLLSLSTKRGRRGGGEREWKQKLTVRNSSNQLQFPTYFPFPKDVGREKWRNKSVLFWFLNEQHMCPLPVHKSYTCAHMSKRWYILFKVKLANLS